MAVPSNWEMAGYSLPTYDSVDNTVGLYRRTVAVPAAWAGKRVYWHFDGALDGAEVFVNGQKAGYHESGYTAWNIDLTGLVHPGNPTCLPCAFPRPRRPMIARPATFSAWAASTGTRP